MVATPKHIPGSIKDPLVARIEALERTVANLANKTFFSASIGAGGLTILDGGHITLPLDGGIEDPDGNVVFSVDGRAAHDGFLINAASFAAASPGGTTVATQTLTAPVWANAAVLTMVGQASITNGVGSTQNLASQVNMIGATTPQAFSGTFPVGVGNGIRGATTAVFSERVTIVPSDILTFTYLVSGGGSWPTDATANATFMAQLEYFRESP